MPSSGRTVGSGFPWTRKNRRVDVKSRLQLTRPSTVVLSALLRLQRLRGRTRTTRSVITYDVLDTRTCCSSQCSIDSRGSLLLFAVSCSGSITKESDFCFFWQAWRHGFSTESCISVFEAPCSAGLRERTGCSSPPPGFPPALRSPCKPGAGFGGRYRG